jgi:hypothetical protein
MKEIYLLTLKDPLAEPLLKKVAFNSFEEALQEYNSIFTCRIRNGYAGTDNTQTDENYYVKSAKLTLNGVTVRIRLENVKLF